MKITQTGSLSPLPRKLPKAAEDGPKDKVVYNHLPAPGLRLRNPLAAAAGTVVGGGLGLGLASLASASPGMGVAAALVGGVVGGYLGANHDSLNYSLKAKGREWGNRWTQSQAERAKESVATFPALGQGDRIGARSTGRQERLYDGFDSSRDIAALYAREGSKEEPYALEVELAHLRPAAEHGHLDTKFRLAWKGGELELDVDHNQKATSGVQVAHSEIFKRVQVRLDKEVLRQQGWSDGQPLQIEAMALDEKSGLEASRLEGRSDQVDTSKIFRWEGKTVYSVVTDRFANGDPNNDQDVDPNDPQAFHGGDWQGIIGKLDYLKDLNVDCVWISCPYEAQRDFLGISGFHGYWPNDFQKTEPNFGDRDKLRELVKEAHDRGIKVMLDVVLNHTSYGHPFTTDPEKKSWFNANGNISGLGQSSMENGSLCGLPDLNQNNPEVKRHLIEIHKDWLQDVDAFRMDALRHMPQSFLREFNQEMHQAKPGFFAVGEAFWLESNFVAGYQNHTIDSMFDFPLAYAIRRTFAGDESRTISDRVDLWKEVKPHASQHEAWRVLLDSHKSQGMELLSDALNNDRLYDNPLKLGTFIDNHDMVRFMSDTGGDERRLEQALAFLYAVRGTPHVYYGTEVAMEGIGPANRDDMKWGSNPEMTEKFGALTQARRDSDALQYGSQVELHVAKDTYGFSRVRPEEEVVCLFNKSDEPQVLSIALHPDSPIPEGAHLRDMFSDSEVVVKDGRIQVTVEPKGYNFLQWRAMNR